MLRMVRRGALIVFEGADKSGKTTQTTRLVDRLKKEGHAVELQRFPDRSTPIGAVIDAYLRGTEKEQLCDQTIHLLFSANRWELRESILRRLNEGITLIVDRYAYSGVAYTCAKDKPDLSFDWCRHPDIGLPRPDRVFYLDVPFAVRKSRGSYGDEVYDIDTMQMKVEELFKRMHDKEWRTIDAGRPIDVIHDHLAASAKEVIRGCAILPVGRLWADVEGTAMKENSAPKM